MSNKDRLPNELAHVQARLMALEPTQHRVDRDELMYCAGFAAAQAQGSQRLWMLPVVSAAAAVIAFAATRHLSPKSGPAPSGGRIVGHTAAPEANAVVGDESLHKQRATVRPGRPVFRLGFSNAPLLAARERALRFDFVEPTRELVSGATITMDPAASIEQLREEFLPVRRNPAMIMDAFPWKWLQSWNRKGETT